MTVKNGYTGAESTVNYEYPKAANTLYAKVAARPALNDHLTKIITQLYIANTPWLPNENLYNHRRLGLPFWEIPTSTMSLTEMEAWNKDSYKNADHRPLRAAFQVPCQASHLPMLPVTSRQ